MPKWPFKNWDTSTSFHIFSTALAHYLTNIKHYFTDIIPKTSLFDFTYSHNNSGTTSRYLLNIAGIYNNSFLNRIICRKSKMLLQVVDVYFMFIGITSINYHQQTDRKVLLLPELMSELLSFAVLDLDY